MLIGDPGVGKTAIVEGLAQRIIDNRVPDGLKGVTILSLNMGALMGGTRYRGEMEQRISHLLKYLQQKKGKAILFIDEIHSFMGAGTIGNDQNSTSNLLKPGLARGDFMCIGATTLIESSIY
jgi:ATP-dependent Clp protease ATP-binding subunit ClpA